MLSHSSPRASRDGSTSRTRIRALAPTELTRNATTRHVGRSTKLEILIEISEDPERRSLPPSAAISSGRARKRAQRDRRDRRDEHWRTRVGARTAGLAAHPGVHRRDAERGSLSRPGAGRGSPGAASGCGRFMLLAYRRGAVTETAEHGRLGPSCFGHSTSMSPAADSVSGCAESAQPVMSLRLCYSSVKARWRSRAARSWGRVARSLARPAAVLLRVMSCRGRDRDLESLADRLGVGVSLEVFIAAGAVGSVGDVEVAGVGGEVQDLRAGKQTRVGGEGNRRLADTDTDRGVQLVERAVGWLGRLRR
jgi:hypothetical protein